MATSIWHNTAQASWLKASEWSGGVVPRAADTAVITGNGDSAPTRDLDGVYQAAGNDSVVDLTSALFVPTTVFVPEKNYLFEYTKDTPPPALIPQGVAVAGIVDLIGGTGATEIQFQKSTLTSTSITTINGIAAWRMSYNDLLAGHVRVGAPIELYGHVVPPGTADANGVVNELDIAVLGNGSWTNTGALSGYVPTVTNAGVITVQGDSGLLIELKGNPLGAINTVPGYLIAVQPQQSAFVNTGTIAVGAGSTFDVFSADSVWRGVYSTFTNAGVLSLQGGAGYTTSADLQGVLKGTGRIYVSGGTQTDSTKTEFVFDSIVTGQSIFVGNATAVFDINSGLTKIAGGAQFSGGSFTFGNGNATLGIAPAAFSSTLGTSFSLPIFRFGAGDEIIFGVDPAEVDQTRASFTPVWNNATHTLSVNETYYDFFGSGTFTAASFKLEGAYSAASFKATSTWDGYVNDPFIVTVTTSTSIGGTAANVRGEESPLSYRDALAELTAHGGMEHHAV